VKPIPNDLLLFIDAFQLLSSGRTGDFLQLAKQPETRRLMLGTDPAGLSPGWQPWVHQAQHLCRTTEARIACEEAVRA